MRTSTRKPTVTTPQELAEHNKRLRDQLTPDAVPLRLAVPVRPETVRPYVALFAQYPHVGIETNTASEADFLLLLAHEMCRLLEDWPSTLGERGPTVAAWLAHSMDIGCRMRGYKSEEVIESRVLYRGTLRPSDATIVAKKEAPDDASE